MKYFNTLIRVCKSIEGNEWGGTTIVQEMVEAESKEEVKKIILKKYPQFFQDGKLYTRETKNEAQFFYVLIYEYSSYGMVEGKEEWECSYCGKQHKNSLEFTRTISSKFQGKIFCSPSNLKIHGVNNFKQPPGCLEGYEKEFYKNNNAEDNRYYINENSNYYIYKITEKSTGKSYIGQTRNIPFFRWWQHLQHSSSPFGFYLRSTKLSDWTFEVLEELNHSTEYSDLLEKESRYILENNSIENGFNVVISKKSIKLTTLGKQTYKN